MEDLVSLVHRSADKDCHYCISDLLIEIYFPIQFMCILNMNIESMDARVALTHLYISCLLCLLLLRANYNCNCIGKAQHGSTSTVRNKVQFYIP